jgi:hypothetical protein
MQPKQAGKVSEQSRFGYQKHPTDSAVGPVGNCKQSLKLSQAVSDHKLLRGSFIFFPQGASVLPLGWHGGVYDADGLWQELDTDLLRSLWLREC